MEAHPRTPRVTAVRREEERVTALELFFDLVFVLALTQCTALMADRPDVAGTRPRPARARRPLVVVGRLRLAHERRRSGGGNRPARDVRRDGGVPRRCAVGAGRVRKRRACLRVRLRDRPGGAHLAVHDREPRRSGPAAVRHGPCGQHGRRRRPAPRSFDDRRRAPGSALVRRAPPRRRRAVPLLGGGLAPDAGALRRAARADHPDRPRRVDRRDRRRVGGRGRRVGGRRGHTRSRARSGALVALLRRDRLARRAAPVVCGARTRAERARAGRLLADSTSRWWRESCSRPSG